ncbi:MAG: Ni/Fe hydrogenase subunit alpha [Phycisphaerales bacterium]|nr:Ni/Fe hydrogenase subunit alpha [Phycisphaerales bacterium]
MTAESDNVIHIDVKEISRVEGHGNLSVRLDDGEITRLELQITESPRFFESFLRGRRWHEAPHICGRICGICSITHTTAAAKAIEAACGITITEQTRRLRELLLMGEIIQSHVLHLCFLAIPDYFGVDSIIPLASSHPEVVKRALRLKKLANEVGRVVAGRHIHPPGFQVGGFSRVPTEGELRSLLSQLCAARSDVSKLVELISRLTRVAFDRETEYVALKAGGGYALYEGELLSSLRGAALPVAHYREQVCERVVEHSAAKHASSPNSPSYFVGALARFNLSHTQLHKQAIDAARLLHLSAPAHSPFANNLAQCVEIVHCLETAIEISELLLADGLRCESPVKPARFGRGVGAIEAPRGVLFHEFELDDDGLIRDTNLVIPTGQNLANIENDLREYVRQLLAARMERADITRRLEMLIRAYDPCISCATHFLDIDWVTQ